MEIQADAHNVVGIVVVDDDAADRQRIGGTDDGRIELVEAQIQIFDLDAEVRQEAPFNADAVAYTAATTATSSFAKFRLQRKSMYHPPSESDGI